MDPKQSLINQNAYRAGPRHRDLEHTEADEMIVDGVNKPANTE